jgi:hypothetical protein
MRVSERAATRHGIHELITEQPTIGGSMRKRLKPSRLTRGALAMVACTIAYGDVLWAEEKSKDSAGVVHQVGTSLKKLGEKIGTEVSGGVKKLEESETPRKVGQELKRSAESLGHKAEQAGKKIKESFKSE